MNLSTIIRKLALLSIALPTLASAEVIPEGAGIIYGKDHVFSLKAPKGWSLDNTSGAKGGLHAVFFPQESSWAKSKAVAYARSRSIEAKLKSEEDLVKIVIAQFHENGSPNYKGVKDQEIKTKSDKIGVVYKFTGDKFGNFEAACYFKEKKTINYIVLSSRDKASFEKAWEPFLALCKSYRYITDGYNKGEPIPKKPKKPKKPSTDDPAAKPSAEPSDGEKSAK